MVGADKRARAVVHSVRGNEIPEERRGEIGEYHGSDLRSILLVLLAVA